jgi:hypothetical protein
MVKNASLSYIMLVLTHGVIRGISFSRLIFSQSESGENTINQEFVSPNKEDIENDW